MGMYGLPDAQKGHITFVSLDPFEHFTCRLGDGDPNVNGGYAGWTITNRKRRRGLTSWDGNEPLQIEIPILFDDFRHQNSQEVAILALEHMAGWGMRQPPLVNFDSAGVVPHDHVDNPKIDWVIKDISWGAAVRNVNGNRVRAAATVTIMQYIEDDDLHDASAAARRRASKHNKKKAGKGSKKSKIHIVKKGETLTTIAAHALGKASRWHEIAKLNHIRDPKNVKVGQHLRMP